MLISRFLIGTTFAIFKLSPNIPNEKALLFTNTATGSDIIETNSWTIFVGIVNATTFTRVQGHDGAKNFSRVSRLHKNRFSSSVR